MAKKNTKNPKREIEKSKQVRRGKKFRKAMDEAPKHFVGFASSNMEMDRQMARWDRELLISEILAWIACIIFSVLCGLALGNIIAIVF